MGNIDINDVQARIVEMLEAVELGQTLSITRNGKAVALLEPVRQSDRSSLPSMAEFRESLNASKACTSNSVTEMRDQERF